MTVSPEVAAATGHIVAAITLANGGDAEAAVRYLDPLTEIELRMVAVGALGMLVGVLGHAGVDIADYCQRCALLVNMPEEA